VRQSGGASRWVEDAERVYYINLDGESASVFPGNAALIEHVEAARGARAIIADMRAYPGLPDHFEAHCLLSGGAAMSPIYRVPIQRGPRMTERDEQQWLCAASGRPLDVPLVVLVGPSTQSAAENTAQVLRMARRVRVIGRPTSGSNGNITGLELPGGISLTFTGMEVLNQDRSAFHHAGVPVDEIVPRTAADFASGVDPDLRAALALIEREGW
jgi:C-terminal processing protease CtpA/Prc